MALPILLGINTEQRHHNDQGIRSGAGSRDTCDNYDIASGNGKSVSQAIRSFVRYAHATIGLSFLPQLTSLFFVYSHIWQSVFFISFNSSCEEIHA